MSDERVALPDGPGSIGGAGENLSASGNMGAMSYEVPLELPGGFLGATPSLALRYSSMGGNEVVGIGWDLSVPHIERSTARGLPTYRESDVFAADGEVELSRVRSGRGVRRYRARFEGSFVRYTWHPGRGVGADYWEAEYPDGSRAYFGADATGKVDGSARATHPSGEVFRYMVVETVDRFGHRVRYRYLTSDGDDATREAYPLLSAVEYLFGAGGPRYRILLSYQSRPDRVSNGLPGFLLQLNQRLHEVEVCTAVAGLGTGDECPTSLVRYTLQYDETESVTSQLVAVDRHGLQGAAYPATLRFAYSSSLDAGCADCGRPFVYDMGALAASGGGGLDLANGLSTLIDINGDALPDVLQTELETGHHFYLNEMSATGSQKFSVPRPSAQATEGIVLSEPGVQVADLNGDGFADLFRARDRSVLCNRGEGDWATVVANCGSLSDVIEELFQEDSGAASDADPRGLRFMDVNGDRRIDLLQTPGDGSPDRLWLRTDTGFEESIAVDALGKVFDVDRVQLADLNGDGLLDAVEVQDDLRVWYRLHLGRGQWTKATTVGLDNAPAIANFSEVSELQDLNGDGQDDLVVVQGASVFYALHRAGRFLPFTELTSAGVDGEMPLADNDTVVLFADMNASGTTDVVWISKASGKVRVLEPFAVRPNLLTRTDNGLGGRQVIEYGSSARERARDEADGNSWHHKLPQAINVVARIERFATLTPNNGLRVERRYHHGYYDRTDKGFRGFARVDEEVAASTNQEGSLLEQNYDVGSGDSYRQGLLLGEDLWSTADTGRYPVQKVEYEYSDCPVADAEALNGQRPVRRVCQTAMEILLQEGKPTAQWLTLRQEQVYDDYGNVVHSAKHGVVGTGPDGSGACAPCSAPKGTQSGACGPQCLGDEAFVENEYLTPGRATARSWNLGAVTRSVRYSRKGGPASETLTFYDGRGFKPFEGTRNSLERGLVVRVCERVTADAMDGCRGDGWVQRVRVQHDVHGNVITELDPLGDPGDRTGHRRAIDYDAYGLKPTAVTLFTSAEGEAYQLKRTLTYDDVFYQPACAGYTRRTY